MNTPEGKKREDHNRKTILRDLEEAQEKVRESEDRYRTIFRLSPEAIGLMDAAGRVIELNGRIYDILGYRPEEVIGKPFAELPFFTKESMQELLGNFVRRLHGEEIPPYEVDFIAKNGERRVGCLSGALIKDSKGNPAGNIVIFSDITRFKQIEEELIAVNKELEETNSKLQHAYEWMRESRDKLRKQIQQEEMGVLIDREGNIEGVTERVVEFFGKSRSQLIGSGFQDLLDQDFQEEFRKELKQAWKGIANMLTVAFVSGEGRKVCEMRMTRFNGADGRSLLVIIH